MRTHSLSRTGPGGVDRVRGLTNFGFGESQRAGGDSRGGRAVLGAKVRERSCCRERSDIMYTLMVKRSKADTHKSDQLIHWCLFVSRRQSGLRPASSLDRTLLGRSGHGAIARPIPFYVRRPLSNQRVAVSQALSLKWSHF